MPEDRQPPPYLRVIKGGLDTSDPTPPQRDRRNQKSDAKKIEDQLIAHMPELVAMLRLHIPESSDFPRDEKNMRERIGILLWNLRLAMQRVFPEGIPPTPESIGHIAGEFRHMEIKGGDPIDEYLLPPLIEQVIIAISKKIK